jgi:hypothetical protein
MRLRVVVQAQERFNRRLESQHQADVRRVRQVKARGRKIQGKLQAAARQVRSERAAWRLEEGEQRRQLKEEWQQVTGAGQAAGVTGRGQEQVGEAPKRGVGTPRSRNSSDVEGFEGIGKNDVLLQDAAGEPDACTDRALWRGGSRVEPSPQVDKDKAKDITEDKDYCRELGRMTRAEGILTVIQIGPQHCG